MKNYKNILLWLLLFLSTIYPSIISAQNSCFDYFEDLSGLPSGTYTEEINEKACSLKAEFPTEFQNDFKVFDIGFYAHAESMYGTTDQLWESAKTKAASLSQYYLLIGRELNSDGVYSRIRTDLVLPTTGVFHCINENYLQVIKNTLSNPIELDKVWNSYPKNIYTGIDNLTIEIKRIKNCCENGGNLNDCFACPINFNDAVHLLESRGYSNISGLVTISNKTYSNILSNYDIQIEKDVENEKVSYSYTDHLELLGADGYDVKVRVKYYDEANCKDLMSFEELAYDNNEYYEDIIILNFGGKPTILSKVLYDEQEFSAQLRSSSGNTRSPDFIPWLAYQVIKRAAMAAVGAVVDFGIQMGMERLVGGHNSWEATWNAIDVDVYSLLESAIGGAFSDSKYVIFATNTLGPSVRYMYKTPASEWNATGFAKAFGEGAMQAAVDIFLGKVMKHIDAAVQRSGLIPVARINTMVTELTQKLAAKPSLIPKLRYVVKAWNLAYFAPTARKNTSILESLAKALSRNLKELPEIITHANHPNITEYTVTHLFRGHGSEGRHHISSLIADNSKKLKGRINKSGGFYEADIEVDGKLKKAVGFFPDEWDEFKVIDEVKHAWLEALSNPKMPKSGMYYGRTTTGQYIRMTKNNTYNNIQNAFPVFDYIP